LARNDPERYGERILYQLPRDVLVPGPQQVESLIEQDPEISQQLSLWRQGGSTVSRGHLVVLPIDSTLVYVEPLFLEATTAAIPQLARVILTAGPRSVMAPSLAGAVAALLVPGAAGEGTGAPVAAGARPAGAAPPGAARDPLGEARRLLERADAQLRAGDLSGFGRSWAELRELLRAPAPAAPRRP
jgi:uncharacterized membrane protein (UPF0182 family)